MDKEGEIKKLLYRPDELVHVLGICRTKVYEFMRNGDIKSFKISTKRYIKVEEVEKFINNMENKENG